MKNRIAIGVHGTDSHANFVYLPPRGRPRHEVSAEVGPRVRCCPDGARVNVGDLPATLAVPSAVENSPA
ncbi:hypothetical protein [Mycobacterium sp.]|uniref:hypothetical protein n=1 Tax=Mycobacterium sp. TaxID=1785 RepID=UPI0031D2ACB2